jgi:hypothetical protein
MPSSNCFSCGEELNGVTCVGDDAIPEPGDVTVCIHCGHIMAFGESLKLRELIDEELVAIAGDPNILAVQAARARVKEKL